MADTHPLDRPIWNALTSRQAHLALGGPLAWRFRSDIEPFGAAADASAEALAALKALDIYDGGVLIVEAEPVLHASARFAEQPTVVQMIWTAKDAPDEAGFAFFELGDPDAPEMFELAALTRPGPYAVHTHGLGGFIGVRDEGGRLIAMAGERMKPTGFCEVSGVCTHPDHRGKGYAAGLMRTVIARILARGETPFLHAYAANTGAIGLYESLGFSIRRTMRMLVLKRG